MPRILAWFLPFAVGVAASAADIPRPGQTIEPQATVKRYCIACHNDKNKTADVSLSGLRTDDVPSSAALWEKVLRKIHTGEMPPPGLPRPSKELATSFHHWLEKELDQGAKTTPNPGTPVIHRLNRSEYANVIRDLLDLEFENASSLPADDSGYGFDNIGAVLTVSPLHMEKYLSAARRVSALAVGTARQRPAIEKYGTTHPLMVWNSDRLPLSYQNGIELRRHYPVDAEYSLMVRIRGNVPANAPPPKLDLRVDGERVKLFDVTISRAEEQQDSRNYEVRVPLTAGVHTLMAGLLGESTKAEGGAVPLVPGMVVRANPPTIDSVTIGGPYEIKGVSETAARKRIFTCRPGNNLTERACATEIISNIARRAYRRPVKTADVTPLMKMYAAGRKQGDSFDSGIEAALRAILVSPSFLYRAERDPAGSTPGSVHAISDLELATRLSFFLWSSIPDEELLGLAERNKLRPVLAQQVSRMLKDPKSEALIDNFGGQWLHLRNIPSWRPDPDKYPGFDDALRLAFQRETELFFQNIVREDRSVVDFLNADYSFLNDRLAKHYGVDGVRGGYFRKVAMDGERGGLLTQGSILTVSSYPTRTSPVLRGKWILENVLGAPPPPPPPDVPDLSDSAEISASDLRKALEQHRASAACASCHALLDPLGFSLEGYDAVGQFRKAEGGSEIDTSGKLPGGQEFRGASGLRTVLLERQDDFVECLSEKLLTYALGRGLEYYDRPAVREVRRQAAANDYRFSAIALAIANSVPFQMRKTPER